MPDRIPPEDREKLINDMVLKLRMSTNQGDAASTGPTAWQRYGTAIIGLVSGLLCVLVTLSWNESSQSNRALATTLETMRKDLNETTAKTDQNTKDVARVEGHTTQLTGRLEQGQAQRIENDRRQAEEASTIKSSVAVLSTKQDNMQGTLERILRKLEEVRQDGRAPFGERQMWNERRMNGGTLRLVKAERPHHRVKRFRRQPTPLLVGLFRDLSRVGRPQRRR